jgi:hypothetical protein
VAVVRHALDFSAPRLSDLPREELRIVLLARDAGRREAYRRQMEASEARDVLRVKSKILRVIGMSS